MLNLHFTGPAPTLRLASEAFAVGARGNPASVGTIHQSSVVIRPSVLWENYGKSVVILWDSMAKHLPSIGF